MEYHLTEVTRYAVACEVCKDATGNHSQPDTAQREGKKKGFIAIVTPEDGTINLCPKCIPPAIAKFYKAGEPEPESKDPKPAAESTVSEGLPLGPSDDEG
jgi:hypothetical protein